MNRLRARAAAFAGDAAVAAFAVFAVHASFTASPAEAYLFPRLSSALLALFCAANIALGFRRLPLAPPISAALCRKIAPGALIIFVYVACAELAGFYPSSAAAFFALAWQYAEKGKRVWVAPATALAMLLAYFLFSVLLQVQTPEAFWTEWWRDR